MGLVRGGEICTLRFTKAGQRTGTLGIDGMRIRCCRHQQQRNRCRQGTHPVRQAQNESAGHFPAEAGHNRWRVLRPLCLMIETCVTCCGCLLSWAYSFAPHELTRAARTRAKIDQRMLEQANRSSRRATQPLQLLCPADFARRPARPACDVPRAQAACPAARHLHRLQRS